MFFHYAWLSSCRTTTYLYLIFGEYLIYFSIRINVCKFFVYHTNFFIRSVKIVPSGVFSEGEVGKIAKC